ncbi:MAG: thiamine transporter membrane protein [marine bacterium B5-7]|nr:MAG: thiamine transporter membrane protein [marine bacterium B5-7]
MSPSGGIGVVLACVVVILALAPLVALTGYGGTFPDTGIFADPYLARVLRFSLLQASLSTLLSVLPAILVARALARRPNLPARRLVLGLLGVPLVVPSIVVVLGVVSVFGADGWLPLGRRLYGLTGILIAHVFFNLPLAARLLLPSLEQIPSAQRRLAHQLGFNSWQYWRHIEWPALRGALPGTALLIFMLCLTSFAVVLTLGGGPRSTTLEVAIYQSLRFDFNPPRAVSLALMQLGLCAMLAMLSVRLTRHREVEGDSGGARHFDRTLGSNTGWARLADGTAIGTALALVAGVLTAIVVDGANTTMISVLNRPEVLDSLFTSLFIALIAAAMATLCGWLILTSSTRFAAGGREWLGNTLEGIATIVYVVPPLVIGTGYFLMLHRLVDLDRLTVPVVIAVNALMGLPFVIRSLAAPMRQRAAEYGRLCTSLKICGWQRFVLVDFPLLRRPLGLAAALAAALSFGDLGVVALFASNEQSTLPLLLYRYLSAYRVNEAAVVGLLLLGSCLMLFVLVERVLGGPRHAGH